MHTAARALTAAILLTAATAPALAGPAPDKAAKKDREAMEARGRVGQAEREAEREARRQAREAERAARAGERPEDDEAERRREAMQAEAEERRERAEEAREAAAEQRERAGEAAERRREGGRDALPPGLADNPEAAARVRDAQQNGNQGASRERGKRPWWQFWGSDDEETGEEP